MKRFVSTKFYSRIKKIKNTHPAIMQLMPNAAGGVLAVVATQTGLLQSLASGQQQAQKPVTAGMAQILTRLLFMVLIAASICVSLLLNYKKNQKKIPVLPVLYQKEPS